MVQFTSPDTLVRNVETMRQAVQAVVQEMVPYLERDPDPAAQASNEATIATYGIVQALLIAITYHAIHKDPRDVGADNFEIASNAMIHAAGALGAALANTFMGQERHQVANAIIREFVTSWHNAEEDLKARPGGLVQ